MLLEDFLALMVNGVTLGAVYAMAGIGLNIAYKPTNVFNLAQGEFVMLGAMLGWLFLTDMSMAWIVGTIGVVLAVGALGVLEERVAVAPHLKVQSHHHGWLISTLAFSIIIINIADQVFRADPRFVPSLPGTSLDTMFVGPVAFNTHQVAVLVIVVASVFAIEYVYRRTRIGKAISAVSEDRDGARLNGINPLHLTMISFAAGAAYCAFAGIIAAPLMLASTSLGLALLVKGFMAIALGGVGSNWGTLLAGIIIGCVESLSSITLSTGYRQLLLLGILLVVLLIRPNGLFGKAAGRSV
ncbi:amino acid/amide ABC transporter membrane protein 1 (HAAT family) [Mesorhizobium sp. J18]|uniref:branched-chain amino acid ABC transporter permease n=1 Tax=Mesorhizobium sp. J18 TaxID=935263 RepID=UPI0011999E47|nr:branched-chain amino acid ABC transporter permease [Mesorhizobium sp. J18]TWH01182.1 amino acid/amide ABC transporter membrane protein 1 (HAAT family) [Mesorhizobium sp. J18]